MLRDIKPIVSRVFTELEGHGLKPLSFAADTAFQGDCYGHTG